MARPMIELFWEDGRITRFPEHNVRDMFGRNVQPELEIRLDDISGGIILQLRHSEDMSPMPGDHSEPDPRGKRCDVFADAFYEIASADELEKLSMLCYEGRPWVIRYGGELVNLGKLHVLTDTLIGKTKGAVFGDIVAAADALSLQRGPGEDDEEKIASDMGIPVELLTAAYAAAGAWTGREAGEGMGEPEVDYDFS